MVFCCFVELGEDYGGGDSVVGGEVEDVAGAIVYPGRFSLVRKKGVEYIFICSHG